MTAWPGLALPLAFAAEDFVACFAAFFRRSDFDSLAAAVRSASAESVERRDMRCPSVAWLVIGTGFGVAFSARIGWPDSEFVADSLVGVIGSSPLRTRSPTCSQNSPIVCMSEPFYEFGRYSDPSSRSPAGRELDREDGASSSTSRTNEFVCQLLEVPRFSPDCVSPSATP